MDDLTAVSEAGGRPKRSAEAMMGDPSPNLLQPYPQTAVLPPMHDTAGLSSSTGLGPYGISSDPSPPYYPPYEWWPMLSGPGGGPSYQAGSSTYGVGPNVVSSYTGFPSSLFAFDATHLSSEFMQGMSSESGASGSDPTTGMPQYPPRQM
jgi:hypothetical protein